MTALWLLGVEVLESPSLGEYLPPAEFPFPHLSSGYPLSLLPRSRMGGIDDHL